MEVTWLDPARLDRRDVDAAVAVLEAARQVDCPHELSPTTTAYAARLRHGWDGTPPLAGLARDGDGRATGVLEVVLPHWDNTHTGWLELTVDPLARRQGIGRWLFEAGVERIRAAGRSLVLAECFDLPAAVALAKAMGLDRVSEEVQRRQDLRRLDRSRLDHALTAARELASGYEVVRLPGRTPADLLGEVVEMTAAINDAPVDDFDVEDDVFSPERIRAFEAAQVSQGRRLYRLVAREGTTGVLAGHTVVAVDMERPGYAEQLDTSVLRAHRGHRLGVLLKASMVHWLDEEEPQLRVVDTWNAASNAHMIAVNEALGYSVVARGIGWQRHL
jgi:GNAT superfamily N-acetyltransferase